MIARLPALSNDTHPGDSVNADARKKMEDLFVRYAEGVSRCVRLRVGDAELAEEITARIFLTAARHVHQQHGSPPAWLWSIVRTELSRHYRRPTLARVPEDLPANDALPAEQAERNDTAALLHVCLARLSDEEQELISLKFFLGLSNQDIALATGLSANHVGVKVHRILKNLRNTLERPLGIFVEGPT
jgi:RNA polymerase sigma-70 factor (ECF subfamily)